MADLLLFVFAVIGMTHIIVDSDMPLIVWLRENITKLLSYIPGNWGKILGCYQCCGTWCGFFCGFFLISHNPWFVFLSGCAGSFVAQWGVRYLDYLEAVTLSSLIDKDHQ
jgi:hypothetical protein